MSIIIVLGRTKGFLDQLSHGLLSILSRIDKAGYISDGIIKDCYLDYTGYSAIRLDKTSQFNFKSIGNTLWEKIFDDLDDVYGALGAFIIKVAFTELKVVKDDNGFFKLQIFELGFYVRDTYEFMNDGHDQPLGYWGFKGVIKPGPVTEYKKEAYIDKDGERYYRVSNSSFVDYRKKQKSYNKTGDFFVYSKVKRVQVDIVIHLNKNDVQEYMYWKEKHANE